MYSVEREEGVPFALRIKKRLVRANATRVKGFSPSEAGQKRRRIEDSGRRIAERKGRKRGYEFTMALCNCSTPHPWLLHDFLLRSPSFAATLSFSLVLSPATRSFSLCVRIYILHPFFPSFLVYLVSSTSRYLP